MIDHPAPTTNHDAHARWHTDRHANAIAGPGGWCDEGAKFSTADFMDSIHEHSPNPPRGQQGILPPVRDQDLPGGEAVQVWAPELQADAGCGEVSGMRDCGTQNEQQNAVTRQPAAR